MNPINFFFCINFYFYAFKLFIKSLKIKLNKKNATFIVCV